MINVSDEIKQAYDESTVQLDKIVVNGEEYTIGNVEYYDDVYNEGNIFGTAIGKCLDFEIENIVNLEGQEFEYLTGIKVNGTTQWISLGNFITSDVEINDTTNIVKVSAMDYMLKSNILYVTTLDYSSGSVTLLQVLQEGCDNSGIVLATTDFPNSAFIVDSNQFTEETLIRQVFQAVAQISGTIAKIKENQLFLINPNAITTIAKMFTLNNYAEAEIKRTTHPINVVSLGMSDVDGENITLRDEESITQNGENVLAINDNPFAYSQEKREQLITALYNATKGFEYKSYTFKCQGLPYVETLDKIQFCDKDGNVYDSYVFRFNYKSPNGLESEIEAPSITDATVKYQNIPSALDIARRTEYIVNKQKGTITSLVSAVSILDTTVNNNHQEITEKFNNYTPTSKTVQLEESVETLQTNTYTKTEINKKLTDGSVTKVMTTSGTFDENGMHYEKTGAKTASTINEKGVEVEETTTGEELLFAGFDEEINQTIVRTENLTVRRYLVIGENSRLEDYGDGGGIFVL